MLPAPRMLGIVTAFLSLLGTAVDVARAVEVDPAVLDACPGYNATNVKVDGPRLSANLVLAGKPCNVFGNDIKVLNLTVVYETGTSTAQYMARQEQRCNF
jgi:alpha-glucosidase